MHREALKDVANEYSKALADEQYIEDYEGVPSWVTSCREAPKACGLSESKFLLARAATRKIEGIPDPDEDGSSIKNSKSLRVMQAIYRLPDLNDKQRAYLFETLVEGKSVRHYNKAKVEQLLDKMEKQAEKANRGRRDERSLVQ